MADPIICRNQFERPSPCSQGFPPGSIDRRPDPRAPRRKRAVAGRNLPKPRLDGAAAGIHLAPAVATVTRPLPGPLPPLIRWKFAWIFVAGIALLIFTINGEKFLSPDASLWLLNWVHVFFGLAWTGIDLFMGFLLGPILRRLDPRLRRTVSQELSARFFWIFPMLSTVTPTAGWELARRLGYLDVPYPGFYWVEAAVALVIVMAFFGICILAPVNLWVLWELRKPEPDMALVQKLMRLYLAVTSLEAVLQLTIVVVMTRFRLGL
jgi:hypothetical protein